MRVCAAATGAGARLRAEDRSLSALRKDCDDAGDVISTSGKRSHYSGASILVARTYSLTPPLHSPLTAFSQTR